jgi:hypothetical protein
VRGILQESGERFTTERFGAELVQWVEKWRMANSRE